MRLPLQSRPWVMTTHGLALSVFAAILHVLDGVDIERLDSSEPSLEAKHIIKETQEVRAWIPSDYNAGYSYPEDIFLTNFSRNGICFSGGGYRSFIASVAYLRALKQLDLLKSTRTMIGTSGGSWAVAIYSFAPRSADGHAKSDEELLGNLVEPENITLSYLRQPIPTISARAAATRR